MWTDTRWDHVCDPTWWGITVAALMDMMQRISWNSNLMWAPVEPNGTSSSSSQANSVRTGGLCVNTAEAILPSELTEKTHLCWRGTDDQRRTWRKTTYGVGGLEWWWGGGLKRGEDCLPSVPFRARWRESEGTEYRMRNKWQEWAYKRKWSLELWDWEDWRALEFSEPSLMGLLCPTIHHAEMQRTRSANIHKKFSLNFIPSQTEIRLNCWRLLPVITLRHVRLAERSNRWTEYKDGQ